MYFPVPAESMYWEPPKRVEQSGKTAMTGGITFEAMSRSSRSGSASSKAGTLSSMRPVPVKPARM